VIFDLADGQEREIVFRLGVGRNADDADELVQRFRGAAAARGVLEAVWQYWNHTLGAVQVETPTLRSTCWPTAGLCTRLSPVVSGRVAATTNRAAPSAFATSCRT